MTELGGTFQAEENKSMLLEALEEYSIEYAAADYEYSGGYEPMGIVDSGGYINGSGNSSYWLDQKHASFDIP